MPERDQLDRLIDSELARYAEPRAGLEQRILARVSVEAPARSSLFRGWRYWALAGAVAAVIVLLISIPRFTHHKPTVTMAHANNNANHAPAVSVKNTIPEVPGQLRHQTQATRRKQHAARTPPGKEQFDNPHYPKLDVFPSAQPLSAEERTMADFAAHATPTGREALLVHDETKYAPLEISSIEISPINMPSLGKR